LDRDGGDISGEAALPRLDRILRGLPGGVAVFDENARLVQMNEGLGELFPDLKDEAERGIRYDAWREKIVEELSPDQILKRPSVAGGRAPLVEPGGIAARRLAGNRWVMIAEQFESTGGSVVQFIDVTKMKVAEQRRAISDTMAHMTRLAGALVERMEDGVPPGLQRAGSAEPADGDGRSLRDDLMMLAQRRPLSPKPCFADALANETAAALEPELPKSVTIETVSSVGLWPVFVDAAQAREALRALMLNAAEALDGKGQVIVETANIRATREAAREMPGLKSGEYVRLSISDSGPGMQPELIDRAVMPYFTTKDPKQHSGMGLSDAYCFVQQSGGHLFIDSDGRSGTTVNLFLPRLPESAMPGKRGLRRH
jgi:signal transduction histidine kinase